MAEAVEKVPRRHGRGNNGIEGLAKWNLCYAAGRAGESIFAPLAHENSFSTASGGLRIVEAEWPPPRPTWRISAPIYFEGRIRRVTGKGRFVTGLRRRVRGQ